MNVLRGLWESFLEADGEPGESRDLLSKNVVKKMGGLKRLTHINMYTYKSRARILIRANASADSLVCLRPMRPPEEVAGTCRRP